MVRLKNLGRWLLVGAGVGAAAWSWAPKAKSNTLHANPHHASGVPRLTVLPWNGHKAAFTMTFDDGSPSNATLALPALEAKGVKGTFFLTEDNTGDNEADWSRAAREGDELGNHTVNHCHAADLGKGKCGSAHDEIDRCNAYIESKFGVPDVYTFAYPFVDTSPAYRAAVEGTFLLARAGAGKLVDATATPDWFAIDAKFVEPSRGQTVKDWSGWIDDADAQSKWLVIVFHSILPETWYEGIAQADLETMIDHAKASDDLWIDTFVEVGSYLRAEKMFEAVTPVSRGKGVVWKWTLPRHFPPKHSLRVVVDGGALSQNGARLVRDASGAYAVALDSAALTWEP